MSAKERCETRRVGDGHWVIEGWDVVKVQSNRWRARQGALDVVFGRTLEEICQKILDWGSDADL